MLRYCIVTIMNAPLPRPKRTTPRGKRQQSDATIADEKLTSPALRLPNFIPDQTLARDPYQKNIGFS
jgi:hypothetical protein